MAGIPKISDVKPGQRVTAAGQNAIIGAVRTLDRASRALSNQILVGGSNANVAYVRNETGARLDRGNVFTISGQTMDYPASERHFVLEGAAFAAETDFPFFAVAAETMEEHGIGRAYVSGVCLALISGGAGLYATPEVAVNMLLLADAGPAQALWSDTGAGIAIIRFPSIETAGAANWYFVAPDGA